MSDQATVGVRGATLFVRRFEVTVVSGPDSGARATSDREEMTIGTAEGNDLRLTDPAVSRHHCVLRTHERGLELRDLASRNGTKIGGHVEVTRGFVSHGARLVLGATTIEIKVLSDEISQPLADADHFEGLVGDSPAMRRMYAVLAQCAPSAATVLIHGETGTGKELVAEAIHAASPRRGGPFVVVDCSALSPELVESELFGHERGAFTGADAARAGAFETAHGGTVFLDEIGELPLDLQPKLLRVLESRTTRRVGATAQKPIDVRLIAATHRDLREEINRKRFRADLFYRIHVIRIDVPSLRDRGPADLRRLAALFWARFRPDQEMPPALLDELAKQDFPGNVRELRNSVERAALTGWTPPASEVASYQDARERALAAWESTWVEQLLRAHDGNLARAARAAQMGRTTLRDLARRHGLRGAPMEDEGD